MSSKKIIPREVTNPENMVYPNATVGGHLITQRVTIVISEVEYCLVSDDDKIATLEYHFKSGKLLRFTVPVEVV